VEPRPRGRGSAFAGHRHGAALLNDERPATPEANGSRAFLSKTCDHASGRNRARDACERHRCSRVSPAAALRGPVPLHSPAIFTPASAQHPRACRGPTRPGDDQVREARCDSTKSARMITPWSQGSALTSSGNAMFTRATCRISGSVGRFRTQREDQRAPSQGSRRAGNGAGGQERRRRLEAALDLDLGNFISASNTDP
jgi:hypothetical protein